MYGKEQPMVLTIDKDIFDPQMEQMYLNAQQNYISALQKDYYDTQNRFDNYKKEYGDFFSPILKDNESYDNIANKPIRDFLSKIGPDALRSIEGRSQIQQLIGMVDTGALSKLKASVKQAEAFQKMKSELEAKGLYSEDFQRWINQQRGIKNFEDWDTLKDGVFNQTPTQFDSLNAVTHSWYDQRQKLYKGMKNGQRVYSYDYNDLKNTARANAEGFINTPRGAYEFDKIKKQLIAKDPNISPEDLQEKAFNILDDKVAQANMEMLLPETYEADPFALEQFKADLNDRNAKRAAARAAIAKQKTRSDNRSLGHSHIGESFIAGLSRTTGIPVENLQQAYTSSDWAFITNTMKAGQINAIKTNKSGVAKGVIDKLVTYDDPHIISKSFGKPIGPNNGTKIEGSDASRLYSVTSVYNSMYGGNPVHYTKRHGGDFEKLSTNKHYDTDAYEYSKVPTGRTLTILCKDGRTRIFREMDVYYKQKNENYVVTRNDGSKTGAIGTNKYVKWNKISTPMWYDTHATTEGSGVNTKSSSFIMSPQIDSKFAPEVETNDINMGRSLGDTGSRNTSDARIF